MKRVLLSVALCSSIVLASNNNYKYELTPMVGGTYTEANLDLKRDYANGGLSLGFNLDDSMFNQVELGFLRTLEDVNYKSQTNKDSGISRVFTNVIKDYTLNNSASLYALAGAGVEIFDDEAFNNKNGLFGNYGVGLKYKLSDFVSLKTDLRHLIELDHGDNNLLYTIGLSIPFGKKTSNNIQTKEPMDSDDDGIINLNDKCPDTPKTDMVDENGCSLRVDLNIHFDTNSAIINNMYDTKIKKFADFMKTFPTVKGQIEAHTDSRGTEKYNQELSEKRAISTVKALKLYGIDKSRLNTKGYGETRPIASNNSIEGMAKNRRVEATIQK